MRKNYNLAVFLVILAIFLPVMGVILLCQENTTNAERVAGVNIICGGICLLIWNLGPFIWKRNART